MKNKLMLSSSEEEDEILEIVQDIIIPQLNQIKLNDPSAAVMIKGLANMDTLKLPDALTPMREKLCEWFCDPGAGTELEVNTVFTSTQWK